MKMKMEMKKANLKSEKDSPFLENQPLSELWMCAVVITVIGELDQRNIGKLQQWMMLAMKMITMIWKILVLHCVMIVAHFKAIYPCFISKSFLSKSLPNLYHVKANYILRLVRHGLGIKRANCYCYCMFLLLLKQIIFCKEVGWWDMGRVLSGQTYIMLKQIIFWLVRHGSGIKRVNEPFSSPFPPITLSYGPKLASLPRYNQRSFRWCQIPNPQKKLPQKIQKTSLQLHWVMDQSWLFCWPEEESSFSKFTKLKPHWRNDFEIYLTYCQHIEETSSTSWMVHKLIIFSNNSFFRHVKHFSSQTSKKLLGMFVC